MNQINKDFNLSPVTNQKNLRSIFSEIIDHIEKEQCADGSFISLSSLNRIDFRSAIPYSTTFFTSNILIALQNIKEYPSLPEDIRTQISAIQQRSIDFLLHERSSRWSFNYWSSYSPERIKRPYPDDIDDTFLALAALIRCDASLINPEIVASIAQLLPHVEENEGGPYRTWIVNENAESKWKDVDVAVNSNVGYFLSLLGVRTPRLNTYIESAINNEVIQSQYYPSVYIIAYFIARLKNINNKMLLVQETLKRYNTRLSEITTLEAAIITTSILGCNAKKYIPPQILRLLFEKNNDYLYKPYAFCIDPLRDNKTSYAGASALTAALVGEAMALYLQSLDHEKIKQPSEPLGINYHLSIQALAEENCSEIKDDLRNLAIREIRKTTDEKITRVIYDFAEALQQNGHVVDPLLTKRMALANLYGWMAYDIYDDIMDNNNNDRALLPCANFFLRKLNKEYTGIAAMIPDAAPLFESIMNSIDTANTWEKIHCQSIEEIPDFGDYGNLADRSMGHALGPLSQLLLCGYSFYSEEYCCTTLLFRNYLIARQMNDDAHDWEMDLLNGKINSVGAMILKRFKQHAPEKISFKNIQSFLPELRLLFSKEIIDKVTVEIRANIQKAYASKEKSFLLKKSTFLIEELQRLWNTTERAIIERNKALEFIAAYNQ